MNSVILNKKLVSIFLVLFLLGIKKCFCTEINQFQPPTSEEKGIMENYENFVNNNFYLSDENHNEILTENGEAIKFRVVHRSENKNNEDKNSHEDLFFDKGGNKIDLTKMPGKIKIKIKKEEQEFLEKEVESFICFDSGYHSYAKVCFINGNIFISYDKLNYTKYDYPWLVWTENPYNNKESYGGNEEYFKVFIRSKDENLEKLVEIENIVVESNNENKDKFDNFGEMHYLGDSHGFIITDLSNNDFEFEPKEKNPYNDEAYTFVTETNKMLGVKINSLWITLAVSRKNNKIFFNPKTKKLFGFIYRNEVIEENDFVSFRCYEKTKTDFLKLVDEKNNEVILSEGKTINFKIPTENEVELAQNNRALMNVNNMILVNESGNSLLYEILDDKIFIYYVKTGEAVFSNNPSPSFKHGKSCKVKIIDKNKINYQMSFSNEKNQCCCEFC